MAEMIGQLGDEKKQVALLEDLRRQHEAHPSWAWPKNSVELKLGELYTNTQKDKALALFDQIITNNPTMRSRDSASACLQSVRLRLIPWQQKKLNPDHPDIIKALSGLKTLVLQKMIVNEPIHLEAAIEYIDLQTRLEKKEARIEKRLALLIKTKAEFESKNDLLSQDYQTSRKALPDQDRIVQAYLRLMDAEILLCRSLLSKDPADQKKAREMFQEVQNEKMTPFLLKRAQGLLKRSEANRAS